MRPIALSAAVLLAAVTSARAACSDTLYLQSLTVYSQTLKNTNVLGSWDSLQVDAWDLADVVKAGPVTLTPYEGLFLNPFESLDHELRFSSNCGTDSVGPILSAHLTTDTASVGDYVWKSIATAKQVDTRDTVVWKWLRNGSYQWKVGTQTLWANDVWNSPGFTLVSDTATKVISGWKGRALGFAIRKPQILGSDVPPYPQVSVNLNSNLETPFRQQIENYFTASILPLAKVSVDSIGKGSIDSTRIEVRMYRSVFSKQAPTGVRSVASRGSAFSVTYGSRGWSIALRQSAAISVIGLDGRTIRTFAPSRNIQWDGLDASGAKVRPGIWYVHAQGIGSKAILVR